MTLFDTYRRNSIPGPNINFVDDKGKGNRFRNLNKARQSAANEVVGGTFGTGGIEGTNGNTTRPNVLQQLYNVTDYLKNNWSDQSDTPSNVYRPEFHHRAVNTFPERTVARNGGSLMKKYWSGGDIITKLPGFGEKDETDQDKLMGGIGMAAGMGAGIMDAVGPGRDVLADGRRSVGHHAGKGVLSGVAMGAKLGPLGAAAGAVLGGVSGLISGFGAKKAAEKQQREDEMELRRDNQLRSSAMLAANPMAQVGHIGAGYYANGGDIKSPLTNTYMTGGKAHGLSTNNTELKGNSHENGGIDIPGMNAEVEGGETTAGSYIFSKKLGFADAHRPIARAIGKIESKAPSDERINSLKRLKQREQELMELQEITKQQLNLA